MSEGIEQTLVSYIKSLSDSRECHAALLGSLSQIVGSRIKVVGFPDSVLMTVHDTKTRRRFQRLSVPAYSIVDFDGDPPREPRQVEDGTLDYVSNNSIKVGLTRDESESARSREVTGYEFRLDQIISLELIPETATAQI